MFFKTVKKKPILVIGNGKSAGKIDWNWVNKNKDKFDTFCMNSIYKIFEEKNFYPDYYANLDNVVIKCHKESLQKLLNLKKIKKCFYLSNENFKENETYVKIQKKSTWQGISKSNLTFSTWANTGADCVQLAIMLGYREIYIIGVDGYVEFIKDSELTKNRTLIMKKTPDDNPNYFFKNYQEKGETYNIPNASKWHIPGWNYSAMICNKLKIKYFNLSDNKNYIKKIPFIKYKDFVKKIDSI